MPTLTATKMSELRNKNWRSFPNNENIIVICGSMSHYPMMLKIREALENRRFATIIPEDESRLKDAGLTQEAYFNFKKKVSEEYFRKIRQKKVYGILVVNCQKHGQENYIGPNTFAEIAIAVNAKKSVFLLNDFYDPVNDELIAWRVYPLKGNLIELMDHLDKLEKTRSRQLSLSL